MAKEIMGHVDCPVCGHAHAQVKEDKSGNPFIFCPVRDCSTQVFTRREFQKQALLSRVRPVSVPVTVTDTEKKPEKEASVPVTDTAPPPLPKRKPTFADALLALGGKQ